ncbi:DUF1624 domain-containing protein [Gammaproteobacteria bacterium]
MTGVSSPYANTDRMPVVDAVRGLAIVLMVGYHFCFDLNLYGLTAFRFHDTPFWLGLRAVIVSLFLGVMGVSLHLASRKGLHLHRYLRRLAVVAVCAGLVTLASIQIFPRSYIYFGVLHFVVVASVLALPFLRLDWGNLWLGLILVGLGVTVQLPLFDHPALHWVGMMTYKPFTEDYVPLVPWFGVVLLGLWLGQRFYGHSAAIPPPTLPHLLVLPAAAGRYSLLIYMVHQPVLIGILDLTKVIMRG